MAAKDIYHEHVKTALVKDGWQITHDPLRLDFGEKYTLVDLGAERFIAAEKDKLKIAVEIKSFVGKSTLDDLEKALGQFVLYHDILKRMSRREFCFWQSGKVCSITPLTLRIGICCCRTNACV